METFSIEFDKSSYAPGQIVSGKVVLFTQENIPATYLKVCAHGGAHTKWSENEHRHRTNLKGERESYHETVEYSSRREYLTAESIVWSASGSHHLPAGRHIFPFSFPLPLYCPPSFEGFDGHIRYTVHIELDRPWKLNMRSERKFTVEPLIDTSLCDMGPIVETKSKNTGLVFKNGVVTMKASIPKQAFATREVIPITVSIENNSKKAVVNVRAELNETSTYSASHCGHEHFKKDWKEVTQSRRSLSIKPKTKGDVELTVKVPKTVPSFESELIGVAHVLKVSVDTMSTFGSTLSCQFPIFIGTVQSVQSHPAQTTLEEPVVLPSAPPMLRMESQPPEYSCLEPSAPLESPGLPPTYEEALMDTLKL